SAPVSGTTDSVPPSATRKLLSLTGCRPTNLQAPDDPRSMAYWRSILGQQYPTREDLRLEQRFQTPRSVERVQRAVHGDDIRVARVWTQLEAKIDEKLKFLRRLALDGGCKSLPRRLGIIIATVGRRTWLLHPRLVQRPGIERVKTPFHS